MQETTQQHEGKLVKRRGLLAKAVRDIRIVVGAIIILLFVIMAIFAPFLAPHDPVSIDVMLRRQPPSTEFWLGKDELGRDILSRIIFGARVSLVVGLSATFFGGAFGTMIGLITGYYGGKIDVVLGRFIDVLLAFPGILLALVIVTVLSPGTTSVIIAITIFAIPSFARIVRGSTLGVKRLEYVDAIRAVGASDLRIMFRHILPNIWSPIMVQATLYVGTAIVISATLAFLGVGTQPPVPDWGGMLNGGREFLAIAPHIVMIPGMTIFLLVLGINMFGEGLKELLEPKSNKR